jgi:hypothetical protein
MWKRNSVYDSIGDDSIFSPVETLWFLDWSALPDLLWARIQIAADGSAVVLDLDGKYFYFADRHTVELFLNEDEYSLLAHVIEDGEVDAEVAPPTADSDQALVPLMLVRLPA